MRNYFGESSVNSELSIVNISNLKEHELPDEGRVNELECDMMSGGVLLNPIVVDRNTMVILDGHCRCGALRRLGCSKVAVKFVDYNSSDITVESWNGKKVTKGEVLEAGLKGSLMLPKTSKHMVRIGAGRVHISKICTNVLIKLKELV